MEVKAETTVEINGIKYVKADSVQGNQPAVPLDGLNYVIVRTYSAGVFAGYLKERAGKEVILLNARRLWYWKGAASLSQMAMEGTSDPSGCKFPTEVTKVILTEAIEILPCTEKARKRYCGGDNMEAVEMRGSGSGDGSGSGSGDGDGDGFGSSDGSGSGSGYGSGSGDGSGSGYGSGSGDGDGFGSSDGSGDG